MYRKTIIISLLVVGLMGLWVDGVMGMGKAPSNQDSAPDFTLQDLSGKTHSLSDYKGKIVFLNFWASWCPPCRQEMPSMQKLFASWDSDKYVMLAVNLGESKEKVAAFAQKNGYTFTILLDQDHAVARQYSVHGIPTTILVDAEGRVMKEVIGSREWTNADLNRL